MIVSRRFALVGLVTAAAWACTRVQNPSTTTPVGANPGDFTKWESEARAILSDALETLQTFETFAAFRVAIADRSERRADADLAWDPPTSSAWDEATHVARGLHGRAEQLFLSVSAADPDRRLWREHRDLADAAHGLLELGDALKTYRDRVDRLGPSTDATQTWAVLDGAWARWGESAGRWGVGRAELIQCLAT